MDTEKNKEAPRDGTARYELAEGFPPAKPIPARARKAAVKALQDERRRRLLDEQSSRDRHVLSTAFPSL